MVVALQKDLGLTRQRTHGRREQCEESMGKCIWRLRNTEPGTFKTRYGEEDTGVSFMFPVTLKI